VKTIAGGSIAAELADAGRFTGRVWRTDYIEPESADRMSGLRFVYEPGARSFWHIHEREQAIIAVYGDGLVAWDGLEAPITLTAGDWWHVTPGVAHWHGATPHASFAHVAVNTGGATTWLHEVSEQDYRGVPKT
jgi:quercetin dioxygenase-like cupin family protein